LLLVLAGFDWSEVKGSAAMTLAAEMIDKAKNNRASVELDSSVFTAPE
jgi:hypothetical protein